MRNNNSWAVPWAWTLSLFTILFGGAAISMSGVRFYMDYKYNLDCGGHLKRAADANSVALAHQELKIAVDYLNTNKMTQGDTAIAFTTPEYDVGFWYQNLSSALKELETLSSQEKQGSLSGIEQTNALIKLRESLLDHETVTQPPRIHLFPNHILLTILPTILWVIAIPFFILACVCIGIILDT